jgi:hypothetical protein
MRQRTGSKGEVMTICCLGLDELVSWLETGLLDARHAGVLQEGERERQRNDGTHWRRKKVE